MTYDRPEREHTSELMAEVAANGDDLTLMLGWFERPGYNADTPGIARGVGRNRERPGIDDEACARSRGRLPQGWRRFGIGRPIADPGEFDR